jgi:glycosyltransferase involved in cell wall biosynthesis
VPVCRGRAVKILVLTNLFPTPWDPLRGAFNRQQFERLGRRHEVHVLASHDFRERIGASGAPVAVPNVTTDYFTYVYPPGIGRCLHALCWQACLLWQRGKALRAGHYDIILASWAYPDGVAAGWVARRLGIPYVVKVHGSDLNVQAEFSWRRMQIGPSLQRAGAVVAVSRALAHKVAELGVDPAHVQVIYNGVDSNRFRPDSRSEAKARLRLSTYEPLLLYVGNLKDSKGCRDLLEAFPAVLTERPGARLVYIGSGPAQASLLDRADAMGCSGQVELAGPMPHDALADWFLAADVLCLPSHNEGVPNVVLEAMACGTPVVATMVGGIPEVVPHFAGLLVPPREPDALAASLLEATSREWDHDRIAAHAAGFRWEDNIDRLDHVLKTVALAHHRPVEASA